MSSRRTDAAHDKAPPRIRTRIERFVDFRGQSPEAPPNGRRAAWANARAAALLGAFGMGLEIVGGFEIPAIPEWPAIASIATSLGIAAFLHGRRARPSKRLASILFVVNSLAVAAALFVRDPYYAVQPTWSPFQANKLACIAVALLAPQLWSGLTAITLHLASSMLVLALLPAAVRDRIFFEPIGSIAFAVVGGVLVYSRQQRLQLERAVAKAQAESAASARLAQTILAVRDLANTPIQTIELCNAMLRTKGKTVDPVVYARIDRAVERLREVSRLLRSFEASTKWNREDAAIDATRMLEQGAKEEAKRARTGAKIGFGPARPA